MQPGVNSPKPPEILPLPVEGSGEAESLSGSPLKPETYHVNPETASNAGQVAPPASIPVANPVNLAQASSGSTSQVASVQQPVNDDSAAQNAKSIENIQKTYIAKVERIIAENGSDPYSEVKLIEQTKVDYMRDVYKRSVKLPQEQ